MAFSMLNDIYCGPAPTPATLAASWNLDPAAGSLIALFVAWALWSRASRAETAAVAGLLVLLFISPLCALTSALFSARVFHHVVLVAVVAPLLARMLPLRASAAAPGLLTTLFLLHAATFWFWHYPPFYDAALRSDLLYWTMQFSLLATAVALWRHMIGRGDLTQALLALFATATQMGMLGALLTFAGYPLYRLHLTTTEPFGFSALEDQQLAGLIMWVPGALPYLAVAAWLVWSRLGSGQVLKTS
jgi:putative membrane protein